MGRLFLVAGQITQEYIASARKIPSVHPVERILVLMRADKVFIDRRI
jgi:hypothetical protein